MAVRQQRIQSDAPNAKRKPRDLRLFCQGENINMIDRDADDILRLAVTNLSADAAATHISDWLERV